MALQEMGFRALRFFTESTHHKFDREKRMQEIVLVNSTPFGDIPTLRVSEITYLPLLPALHNALLDSGSLRESKSSMPNDSSPSPQALPPCQADSAQSALVAAIDNAIDVMIMTSKHAVHALEQSMNSHNELKALWEKRAFAIGSGTANALEQAGISVEFVSPSGHGASFCQELITRLQGRRALYLRAKHIISGLDSTLSQAQIPLIQIIAYTNTPLHLPKSAKPPRDSIVIFTAPSNYRAFIENFGWDSSYIAIAIGESTFAAFSQDSRARSYISPKQTLESCVALAKSLRNTTKR